MKTAAFICAMVMMAAKAAVAQALVSPEIHPDQRVEFRLLAPNAKDVQVHCEGVSDTAMQKNENGVWTLLSGRLKPDIYSYYFTMDGLRLTDPANVFLKYNLIHPESLLQVPGSRALPWEVQAVPHGVVHEHGYHSEVSHDDRNFLVYTPPGYDPNSRKRYPVLYLLHGFSDDAAAWVGAGRANVILDNLIARKQASPMIVVMPLGYGTMEVVRRGWEGFRTPELRAKNFSDFEQGLVTEVMPRVAKEYRVRSESRFHAIAGLSMGGTEALRAGLNGSRFDWIGAFSSGGMGTNYEATFPNLNAQNSMHLRLLWIACGTEDRLLADNQKFSNWLASQSIPHTWIRTPGAHSYRVWRRDLAQFATLVFRDGPAGEPAVDWRDFSGSAERGAAGIPDK